MNEDLEKPAKLHNFGQAVAVSEEEPEQIRKAAQLKRNIIISLTVFWTTATMILVLWTNYKNGI